MKTFASAAALCCIGFVFVASASHAEIKAKPEQVDVQTIAIPIVTVKRGDTVTVCFAWSMGTGRVPKMMVSTNAVPTEADRDAARGNAFTAHGITLTPDNESADEVWALMRGDTTSVLPADRPATIRSVRISVAEETEKGIYQHFVHVVSGTARTMVLSAKILVAVTE